MRADLIINAKRKPWLDALRGIAILLVVYGHQVSYLTDFFVFTSPVKMPLFFAISGYVFNAIDARGIIRGLTKKVIVPWLALGLLPVIIMAPVKGLNNIWDFFLKMLSGEVLWFMPCFLMAEIIHYVIVRINNHTWFVVSLSFVCFIIGLTLSNKGILDYAMFNRSLTVQPFFIIGQFFKSKEEQFVRIGWIWIFVFSVFYFVLCLLGKQLYPGESIDVHLNHYFNIPLCLTQIFIGCLLLFTIFRKIEINSLFLSFIGQNTLLIYCWSPFVISLLEIGLLHLGKSLSINWWTGIIKLLWTCAICGVMAIFINKYIPEIVGKKRITN